MLSSKTIATVKSTAGILAQHGETLTRHFYKRMFSHNPEVAPFFNPAHQQAGHQQRALAGAICAYAANIDNLEALGGAVELIAQKHASLTIKPEHYPIVGENLLASISEVLGSGATSDILNAWKEAYTFLAQILISREAEIYREQASIPGGWSGFKAFRVVNKEVESEIITSLYLVPADGSKLPVFKPGQYITVRVRTPDGLTTMRNYSLSDIPHGKWFRISVKRESGPTAESPEGYVSTLLHKDVNIDAVLEVGPPSGEFFLNFHGDQSRPLALIAAGVGITPIYPMLLTALKAWPQRKIIFIHGIVNRRVQAFKAAVSALAQEHSNLKIHFRYSEDEVIDVHASSGLIDATLIESMVPVKNTDFFFCGPKPFMTGFYKELMQLGVSPNQLRFEFFGPKQDLQD